jgi:hypothetical protein
MFSPLLATVNHRSDFVDHASANAARGRIHISIAFTNKKPTTPAGRWTRCCGIGKESR